jgi:uncharacterized protein YegP (UPF0339 family)
VTGSAAAAAHFQLFSADGNSAIRWRLLSGNNRELGRTAGSSPDAETCLLEIKNLLVRIEELTAQVRRREGNVWRWTLMEANVPVALCGRDYDRQVRCEQAVALFRLMAPGARTGETVTLTGSRRWVHPTAGRQPLQLGSAASRERTPPRPSKS